MPEPLAAATLLTTKWDRSAFINPMCGSSTIAIEAALSAAKEGRVYLETVMASNIF